MSVEIAADSVHELPDRAMGMVPRDAGVQVLPLTLDLVVVGAVGRHEVQADPVETRQGELDDPALVNDVVVEDDVDGARRAVGLLQGPQEVDEQPSDLADTLDIDHATAVGRWVLGETAQLRQATLAARGFPGTSHHGARPTPADTHIAQNLPKMPDRECNLQSARDDPGQQLERPGLTWEAEVGWASEEDLADPFPDIIVYLAAAILSPAIEQRGFPSLAESFYNPPGGRGSAANLPGGGMSTAPLCDLDHDAATDPEIGIAGLTVELLDATSCGAIERQDIASHSETSLVACPSWAALGLPGEVSSYIGLSTSENV